MAKLKEIKGQLYKVKWRCYGWGEEPDNISYVFGGMLKHIIESFEVSEDDTIYRERYVTSIELLDKKEEYLLTPYSDGKENL